MTKTSTPLIGAQLRWIATFNVVVAIAAIFVAAATSASTYTYFGWGFAWCGWFCLAGIAWLEWSERGRSGEDVRHRD